MALSPEDIINQALRRLGNDVPVGSLYDGTKPARAGLELYGQTRDDLLRSHDWPFAKRIVAGTTTNAQTAPEPWLYEYDWPADCLKVRYVRKGTVGTYPVYDPRPVLFTVFNDARLTPAVRAILTTVSPAKVIYTGQIIDPTTWDVTFTEVLVEALARRLAVAITGSPDILKVESELSAVEKAEAKLSDETRAPSGGTMPGTKR